MSVRERLNCRMCLHGDLRSVLKLPDTPLANGFVASPRKQKKYPLEVTQCAWCGHSQLRHVVDPKLLFTDYAYVSGTSPSFVKHFEEYARAVDAVVDVVDPVKSLVVEIGSNDGTLLRAFQKLGWRVLGVEPAVNLRDAAGAAGIPTMHAFFSEDIAASVVTYHGQADVVVANNVLAHIDDLDDVVRGVKTLLHPDGLFVFEVQYLGDLLADGMFDMIYHEHLDYHYVAALFGFFNRHELQLANVERVPTHGGSIRCWVQHRDGPLPYDLRLGDFMRAEKTTNEWWPELALKIEKTKVELRTVIDTFKARKANIVAYGAPAKLTTFCYALGLTTDDIDYVVDDSPLKQGKYTPGLNIPVLPPSALIDTTRGWPDAILLSAWNFKDVILPKLKPLIDDGTHVIVPFPEVKVL